MTASTPSPAKQLPPWLALIGFLLLCYAVAAIGALSTASSIPTWYAALVKPTFNPPNSIFGPVWTLLYTLMAIAAWLAHPTQRPRSLPPTQGPPPLLPSAHPQLPLDSGLLLPPPTSHRSRHHPSALDRHPRHHTPLLAPQPPRRSPHAPLSCLGHLCHASKLRTLPPQLTTCK